MPGLLAVCSTASQFSDATEEAHTDAIFLYQRHLFAEIFAQELHQKVNFGFGAAPVFYGKGVESKGFNFEARTGFDSGASRLRADAVAGDARQMTLLRPAAVAVHDYGDMAWQARKIELFEEICFLGSHGT
jgi:hypothetical protein